MFCGRWLSCAASLQEHIVHVVTRTGKPLFHMLFLELRVYIFLFSPVWTSLLHIVVFRTTSTVQSHEKSPLPTARLSSVEEEDISASTWLLECVRENLRGHCVFTEHFRDFTKTC